MKNPNFAAVYCCLYPELCDVARHYGYALAIHGSMSRDFDLVCIPWAAKCAAPQTVVDAITSRFDIREVGGSPTTKWHGRIAYTISFGFGSCAADLSFMPILKDSQP